LISSIWFQLWCVCCHCVHWFWYLWNGEDEPLRLHCDGSLEPFRGAWCIHANSWNFPQARVRLQHFSSTYLLMALPLV
jgi:hypothetical protein